MSEAAATGKSNSSGAGLQSGDAGSTVTNPQALLDRIKGREEEIKKKERELKLREAQVKERTEELESAKTQVDNMMNDVERREQAISDLEKKHGTLSRREDAAHQRDMLLSDREVQLQDKAADLTRREKDEKIALRKKMRECDARLKLVQDRETVLEEKEEQMQRLEQDFEKKNSTFREEQQRQDLYRGERDKDNRTQEAKIRDEWRAIEAKQSELDNQAHELHDRLKYQRQEQMEMESRERDFKWRDEQLNEGLEANKKKKKELEQWEKELSRRRSDAEMLHSELKFRKDALQEGELRLKQRLATLFDAQEEVKTKDQSNDQQKEDLDDQTAQLEEERRLLRLEAAETREQYRLAMEATQRAQLSEQEMVEKQRVLEDQTMLMKEKERAVKDWMVELEFRSSAIKKKELKPAPYMDRFTPENQLELEEDLNVHASPQFSEALTTMTLQRLQGAYLGATMKSRASRARKQEAKRKTTNLKDISVENTGRQLELQCADTDVAGQLGPVEDEFRDLIAGYMAMTKDKRGSLFTQQEEVVLVEAIEFDVECHDEQIFLDGLIDSPLQGVELNVSPQDSKLLSIVTKWVHDRSDMLNARWRRLCEKKLSVYSQCLIILRGRILPAEERRRALDEKFSDGSVGLTAQFRERARTRLPAVVPGGALDATLALPRSRAQTPAGNQTRNTASRGASRGGARSAAHRGEASTRKKKLEISQSLEQKDATQQQQQQEGGGADPEDELVDALPLYLRHHYPEQNAKLSKDPYSPKHGGGFGQGSRGKRVGLPALTSGDHSLSHSNSRSLLPPPSSTKSSTDDRSRDHSPAKTVSSSEGIGSPRDEPFDY